jgi:hypothetical protein
MDKFVSDKIIKCPPYLTADEIKHFLHYLPKELGYLGHSFHCKSGEITSSPYLKDISKIISKFIIGGVIATNGVNLDQDVINTLKNMNIVEIGLSVTTLNPKFMKKYSIDTTDHLSKIELIKENNLNYHIGMLPLKSIIESNDFFETINTILDNHPDAKIRINPPSFVNNMDDDMINELKIDYDKIKLSTKEKYPNLWFIDELTREEQDSLSDIMTFVNEKIEQISDDVLILCPESTSNMIKDSIVVKSSLGIPKSASGHLLIDDYKFVIEKNYKETILLPRKSFDVNFDDLSLENINTLWQIKKVKRVYLI